MTLAIPPLQDVVRLTGHDVETTAANLRRYYRTSGPVWGYTPAKRVAKAVFSSPIPREAAVRACGLTGNKQGRPHNEEVGGLIWDAAQGHNDLICHSLSPQRLNLRPDFAINVDPLFFFRENGKTTFFYLQPRRKHVPGRDGLRMIASTIMSLFAVDQFRDADLLLLDLSAPKGCDNRRMKVYDLTDLPLLEPTEMERFFQRFVDAYDILTAEGVTRKERTKKPPADRGDDLFGGSLPA
ncbi:hypothetical protein HT136_16540 [Novosphingobium profundi]|uniref:hypothetical protein n=1 Tax=Novosphingobium profundi TaxID=1774954 RepID=UPI001BDA5F4D|nr:hypothetical protein [Novosphingobium profundi]MBT0669975.1 hypothetical protein [Novosphingobium profundi]